MASTANTSVILPSIDGELPAASEWPALDFFDEGSDFDFSAVEYSAAISSNPRQNESDPVPSGSAISAHALDPEVPGRLVTEVYQ